MSGQERDESTLAAAGKAVQGLVLERLAVGMVVVSLLLAAYAAVEATGAARAAGVTVGVLGVVTPLAGWRLRWSDPVLWRALLPLTVAILVAFSWATRS